MKRQFPTIDHVWLVAAVALIAMRPLLTPIPPHDFWWHMAMGREIVQTHTIPAHDSFSYTQAGQPFYNQGWLAQVVLYGLHSLGGVPLILVVQSLVVALAYGLLLALCIKRSGDLRLSTTVLLLLVVPISFDNWNVRPQTYAFPLFVAFFYIVTQWRLGYRWSAVGKEPPADGATPPKTYLWMLPMLMVVWVNLHGSFVLGGAVIALTFVAEWVRRFVTARWGDGAALAPAALPSLRSLFGWGVATAAAMLINPRGVGVLIYVFNLLGTSAVTDLVTEWAPPTTRDLAGKLFFGFLIISVLVLAYSRRRPDPADMLFAIAFGWLALGAARNVVWFGLVAAPLLVVQIAPWLRAEDTRTIRRSSAGVPLLNGVLMGFMVLLVVLVLPWIKPALGLPPRLGALISEDTPVMAVEALQADPRRPSHLFHAMSYGSYLIWAAPQQGVFIDPRIELYPFEQWRDYIALNNGHNVDALLNKYAIDGLLLDNEQQAALLHTVRSRTHWQVRYEDEQTTYLGRVRLSEQGP
jgi:hypothetical protein